MLGLSLFLATLMWQLYRTMHQAGCRANRTWLGDGGQGVEIPKIGSQSQRQGAVGVIEQRDPDLPVTCKGTLNGNVADVIHVGGSTCKFQADCAQGIAAELSNIDNGEMNLKICRDAPQSRKCPNPMQGTSQHHGSADRADPVQPFWWDLDDATRAGYRTYSSTISDVSGGAGHVRAGVRCLETPAAQLGLGLVLCHAGALMSDNGVMAESLVVACLLAVIVAWSAFTKTAPASTRSPTLLKATYGASNFLSSLPLSHPVMDASSFGLSFFHA